MSLESTQSEVIIGKLLAVMAIIRHARTMVYIQKENRALIDLIQAKKGIEESEELIRQMRADPGRL